MPFTYFAENSDIVEIKQSKIPGAGLGLFAKKAIKKNQFICWYGGVYIEKETKTNGYYDSDYLLTFPEKEFAIDAADPLSCFGRYCNDGFNKNNAEFTCFDDSVKGGVIATKSIRKGSEIYASYGSVYWTDDEKFALLSPVNQQYLRDVQAGIIEA